MKAVVMNASGEADVLECVDLPDPTPGKGEVLVQVTVAGVNFMDIGVRRGISWTNIPNPKVLGVEGAGRVLAVGEEVCEFSVGDRVSWAYVPGSYAEKVIAPETALVHIPDYIDDRTAASIMMNGITASHFATEFYPVQRGDVALVHAAAGGVGSILSQIIKIRGGQVIGRVSSTNKIVAAKEAGADHVIVDREGNFVKRVLELTEGEGVHVVFDGSGVETFQASLDALRHSGTFCWYGPVLGAETSIQMFTLPKSIKLGYAVFMHHIRTPTQLRSRANVLFEWLQGGKLKIFPGGEYRLEDAALTHVDMWARSTSGKLLLMP